MTHDTPPADDPIWKTMMSAIEQAKEHNIRSISVSVGPFGIPIVESADVPNGTIVLLEPKRQRYSLDLTSQDDNGRITFVARIKPKRT